MRGHTTSDVILYLPEERIAFMSDLLLSIYILYLTSGSPEQWKQSLVKVGGLGVQIAFPGHGPKGKSEDLLAMLQYIQSLESIVVNMMKSGKSAEQASFEPIPPPFKTWLYLENFFVTNLKFLYKRAIQGKETK